MTGIPIQKMVPLGLRQEVRLLVVDDQLEHFEQLQEFAEMYHPEFRVECRLASSACEAEDVARSWKASVVLLDLHVVSSALELLQKLASQGAAVVATTDSRLPELVETVAHYGAVGYLPKSTNPEDLENLLSFVASVSTPFSPQQ